jgi:hypothetical protein
MKLKLFIVAAAVVSVGALMSSCSKNSVTGGIEDVNQYKTVTSYDYLQSRPRYDTLLKVLDAGNLKDSINATNVTFFAANNASILAYLNLRTIAAQAQNQYAKWGLDSLLYYVSTNKQNLRDSLKMYLFKQPIAFDVKAIGDYYPSGLQKDTAIISYEVTKDANLGYNSNYTSPLRVLYFTHLYSPYPPLSINNPASSIPSNVGARVLVRRAGVYTKNGIVNELSESHTLFFRR